MKILEIIRSLESFAPLAYQESYDNAGLITGNAQWECSGAICTLDATLEVLIEAREKNANLVVAHHPIVFKGLTKITGKNYVEEAIIYAIKNDIAIYAIHTNLDNVWGGVNSVIAEKIGLNNCSILQPKTSILTKLITFVPTPHLSQVQEALFAAGAGHIGEYAETSFGSEGMGTFRGSALSNPTIGTPGIRESVAETRLEVIVPSYLESQVVAAMKAAHPYEEVAYDLVPLKNVNQRVGSGIVGQLPSPMEEKAFLSHISQVFGLKMVKHTPFLGKKLQKIAICGGAGSFLIKDAIAAGADCYISADIKYHEFFDADKKLVLADIGHWESEQYTIDLLFSLITAKFPNFAVLKTTVQTNPVRYFLG
ncbi:Nif3-like dinuclear metal center hexameric protein [Sediminibacterium sp. TEGAF015]|uniref:Nif3-like dinuclear metal center hexameric protein n=1 Tax=Sediminibacterium sp. TEGAF015 TaxID=575378 RepID=UPI00220E23A0|nr:Nif3-like dinuclear metal center hexameric protein [Sediminibacterium sp. TEGAF015]BDQ13448.1 GTP cyclohydrolase 1 type 2 [Sediminibacterium sp. TEGAF015]